MTMKQRNRLDLIEDAMGIIRDLLQEKREPLSMYCRAELTEALSRLEDAAYE